MKPQSITIYSENNDFQLIETLRRNREKRNREGLFFVEGVRPINQALAYNWSIEAFIFANDRDQSKWAKNIIKDSKARQHYTLPFNLLKKLSGKEETSELLALIRTPQDNLERITISEQSILLVFDRPASPGNLGTILRSSDAFGVSGLIITGHAIDAYDPEVISASTGSFFALPIVRLPSQKELLDWVAKQKKLFPDLQIVGTDEKGPGTVNKHDFSKPTILLIGNETWGLSQGYKNIADFMVSIPMQGSASSLNVANATSIVLYEIQRQRQK